MVDAYKTGVAHDKRFRRHLILGRSHVVVGAALAAQDESVCTATHGQVPARNMADLETSKSRTMSLVRPGRTVLLALTLSSFFGCGGGGSGGPASVSYIVNKSSGAIALCQLNLQGGVNFTRCSPAADTTLSQPIDLVLNGGVALISVEDGIERCERSGDQLTSCELAVSDTGFPVGLTLSGGSLFVADYTAKSVVRYDAGTLSPTGVVDLATSPTDVVFANGIGYIVTQDVAGSVVLACNSDLDDCTVVYSPLDRALLAMTVYNGVAFITDASGNQVVACNAEGGGVLSDCEAQGDDTIFNYPYGITIKNHVAYVPNRAEATVTVCSVSGKSLVNCAKQTTPILDGPTFVVFD